MPNRGARRLMAPKVRPVRAGLLLLEGDPWRAESLEVFLRAEGFDVSRDERSAHGPRLVIVNHCAEASPIQARLERLRTQFPDAKILVFVREVDAKTAFPCLVAGVKGVLPFDARPDELRAAIDCVLNGSLWTPRPVLSAWVDRVVRIGLGGGNAFTRSEQRVLEGVREDLSNKEIAHRLGVTEATVKFHVSKLLRKTGARDRRELSRFAVETLANLTDAPAAGS